MSEGTEKYGEYCPQEWEMSAAHQKPLSTESQEWCGCCLPNG
jgi:hypothetical protein